MIRRLKAWLIRKRFEHATRAFDRRIEEVRAKHGRVSDEEARKTAALHRALAQAVRGGFEGSSRDLSRSLRGVR